MIRALVLLLPPLISLRIYTSKGHEVKTWLEHAAMYAVFFLTNLTCMAAILYVRGHALAVIDANMNTVGFLLKYLLISWLIAIVSPLVFHRVDQMKLKVRILK